MSTEHQENSESHIPTDWFDKIQLTIHPNNLTASIEYTTKDGPKGLIKHIPLMPPGPRQTAFDRHMTEVLNHIREQIREKIERDRSAPSTTE